MRVALIDIRYIKPGDLFVKVYEGDGLGVEDEPEAEEALRVETADYKYGNVRLALEGGSVKLLTLVSWDSSWGQMFARLAWVVLP